MKKFYCSLLGVLLFVFAQSQLLSWSPSFATENDNITIVMDASKGNLGLLNYANVNDVYVHTGVITSASSSPSDWKYVKFSQNFNQPNAALQAVSLGGNKWQFTITGGIRSYYGVANATEKILRIAILFRSGDGSKVQRNSDGSDMYVPVYDATVPAIRFVQPESEPRYNAFYLPIQKNAGDVLPVNAIASKPAQLTLKLNGTVIQTASNATTISASPTLSVAGNQLLIAEINDGGTVKGDTVRFFIAAPGNIAALPPGVREGLNYEPGDTSVTLVLFAPGKTRIAVIGDFNDWTEQTGYQMNQTPDGKYFWLRVKGLTPSVEYAFQYLVDGSLRIADPYTEKVLDPFHDGSIPASTYPSLKAYPVGKTTGITSIIQTKPTAYSWQVNNFSKPDKRSLIVYEMLLRDYIGAHDWKTLKDTIGYFKRLGINAIELMPSNEFEGNLSWGYNSSFYFAPDKYYGPRNTLKQFIDECHKNGIAVLLDIALNHQYGQSPMVQLYWDAANNRPAANSPWFNPVPKHPFNVGYDMNHEAAETKYFFMRVAEHWLKEYKIDGFRYDLSKGFTQKNSCTSTNCDTGPEVSNWSAYDASRIAIWKRYYDSIQTKANGAYVILEHLGDNTEEKELSDYGMMFWGNMNYNFTEAAMGYIGNSNISGGLSTERGWNNPYLVTYMESHDEERVVYKTKNFGNASGSYNTKDEATALKRQELSAAFLMMMPGPKMLWQFGELGYDFSINYCVNGTINNACRLDQKPIRWDYTTNASRASLFNAYSSFIKLRFHPLFKDAFISNRVTNSLTGAVKWLKLTTDTSNLLIVGNFDVNASAAVVTFQNAGNWYDYMTGAIFTSTGTAQTLNLQPGEYRIYVNRIISAQNPTPVGNVGNINGLSFNVFPNPANAQTKIAYELPVNGNVHIDLYNMFGQKMYTIYNGYKLKGSYSSPIDHDNQLDLLQKGIYLVTFDFNGSRSVQKIIIE